MITAPRSKNEPAVFRLDHFLLIPEFSECFVFCFRVKYVPQLLSLVSPDFQPEPALVQKLVFKGDIFSLSADLRYIDGQRSGRDGLIVGGTEGYGHIQIKGAVSFCVMGAAAFSGIGPVLLLSARYDWRKGKSGIRLPSSSGSQFHK